MLPSLQSLSRAFPPPHFLVAPAAGLAISARVLRFASLEGSGERHLRLVKYGEVEIPEGVFAGGEIKDRDALKAILSDFQKKHSLRSVYVSVPEQPSFNLYLELPPLPRNEIRSNLLDRIEQHVPFSAHDIVFDYEIAECAETGNDRTLCVGAIILPQKIAADYLSLLAECGMEPLSLELGAHALSRALLPKKNNGVYMLVDIDAAETGIAIVHDSIVRFTATITVGGNMLTEALAKKLFVSSEEAARLKKRVGLKKTGAGLDMASILIPSLSTLRDEIKRYFLYWHTHAVSKETTVLPRIQSIILSGEEAGIPGLADYLRGSLKENVVLANPWRNINPLTEYTPSLSRVHSLRFATAFGLALRAHS